MSVITLRCLYSVKAGLCKQYCSTLPASSSPFAELLHCTTDNYQLLQKYLCTCARARAHRVTYAIITTSCLYAQYKHTALTYHCFAVHCVQGVNSALEDALVFDQCLTKHSDSLAPALADYQAQRLPDTKALIRLQVAHCC